MTESIRGKFLSYTEYENNTELKAKYKTYEQYLNAQLKSTSIHKFGLTELANVTNPQDAIREYFNMRHKAFNAKSEELIANYQALAPIANQAKAAYATFKAKIDGQNSDPSLTQQAKLNKLRNAADQAEFDYDAALKTALYHTHSATQFLA